MSESLSGIPSSWATGVSSIGQISLLNPLQ
jgi:hypothetical protein